MNFLDAILHGRTASPRLAGEGAEVWPARCGSPAATPVLGADSKARRRLGRQEVTPPAKPASASSLATSSSFRLALVARRELDELAVHLSRSGLRGLADLLKPSAALRTPIWANSRTRSWRPWWSRWLLDRVSSGVLWSWERSLVGCAGNCCSVTGGIWMKWCVAT